MMFTPRRPVKRQLVFTPASTAKRFRSGGPALRSFKTATKHYGRGPSRTGSLYKQVRSLQTYVNKLKPEVKFTDVSFGPATNVTTAGSIGLINSIAQDTAGSARIGDSVKLLSISIAGVLDQVNSSANSAYRWVVVRDSQQVDSTTPALTDIFVAPSNPIHPLPLLTNAQRFHIVWISPIINAGRVRTGNQPDTFSMFKKLNLQCDYSGIAGTTIAKNGLYLCFLSNDSGNTVDIAATIRVGFTDP